MPWNRHLSDWPQFAHEPKRLQDLEARFLKGSGVVVGAISHLLGETRTALAIELISKEAVDSSAIEGEILNRASVQSSVARHFGLAVDRRRATAAEAGAAEMMADLFRNYATQLDGQQLFRWHAMLMNGRRDISVIGGYRTHSDPMQIVSGAVYAPRVHFEAPPSERVPGEMRRFIRWFNASAPGKTEALPAITRAGIAHLWFESIHPFEDGNGRIGRAIAEKALAQCLEGPTLTALAETINRRRKDYYAELHAAGRSNAVDRWLGWFAQIALEAQDRTLARVSFVIAKTRLLDGLKGKINPRQEKALLCMFAEGPEGFKGGLSAGNYQRIAGATTATATRDLASLVELGALTREGERRHARYRLNLPI
jgi:Fic family protein